MKSKKEKVDCPHCIFSSGFTAFIRGSQVCYLCKGIGLVSKKVAEVYEKDK